MCFKTGEARDAWLLFYRTPIRAPSSFLAGPQAAANFGREVLTPRECEVVKLVLRGYSTKSVSQALGISPGTVKVHREHIYAKLRVSSQASLFNLFIASVSTAWTWLALYELARALIA